jgi:hypothetical protein
MITVSEFSWMFNFAVQTYFNLSLISGRTSTITHEHKTGHTHILTTLLCSNTNVFVHKHNSHTILTDAQQHALTVRLTHKQCARLRARWGSSSDLALQRRPSLSPWPWFSVPVSSWVRKNETKKGGQEEECVTEVTGSTGKILLVRNSRNSRKGEHMHIRECVEREEGGGHGLKPATSTQAFHKDQGRVRWECWSWSLPIHPL